jgi:flagellar motor switch protein FliM
MATSTQMTSFDAPEKRHAAGGGEGDKALVQLPAEERVAAAGTLASGVSLLPVELDVAVPVSAFRVRNLLALECGQVIETRWGQGEDVPLSAGAVQLAWSEFEVVDSQLGVRVTRLA